MEPQCFWIVVLSLLSLYNSNVMKHDIIIIIMNVILQSEHVGDIFHYVPTLNPPMVHVNIQMNNL